jgi:hypothetical protein
MPTAANTVDRPLTDDFDLDLREITVVQEQQEASASGFTCTLFTCPALTCGSSCTSC